MLFYYLKILILFFSKIFCIHLEPNVPKTHSKFQIKGLENFSDYSIIHFQRQNSNEFSEKFIKNICNFKTENNINITIFCNCAINFGGNSNIYKLFNKNNNNSLMEFKVEEFDFNNYSIFKFIRDQHYLFNPLKVRLKLHQKSEFLCLNLTLNTIQIELKYRPFEFVPRSILRGTVKELDYDELDSVQISVLNITTKNQEIMDFEFDCTNFLKGGFYAVNILKNNKKSLEWFSINSTNIKNQPKLELRNDSIFPYCNNDLILAWTLPNCHPNIHEILDFRIRVFASALETEKNENSAQQSHVNFVKSDSMEDEWIYMEEFSANLAKNTDKISGNLAIPCAQFDIIHERFCFELISVERRTRHFELWDRKCVFTEPIVHFENEWSEWSKWGLCKEPCDFQGHSLGIGYRKRTRQCLKNVSKQHHLERAKFCHGPIVQKEICHNCHIKRNFESANLLSENSDEKDFCDCGCNLSSRNNGFLFIGSERQLNCENLSLTWDLERQNYKIKLLIIDKTANRNFNGKLENLIWSSYKYFANNEENNGNFEDILDGKLVLKFTRLWTNLLDLEKLIKVTKTTGFYIDYEFIFDEENFSIFYDGILLPQFFHTNLLCVENSTAFPTSNVIFSTKKCEQIQLILIFIIMFICVALFICLPPIICSILTKNYTNRLIQSQKYFQQHKYNVTPTVSQALIMSNSQKSEMARSGHTNSTQVSPETIDKKTVESTNNATSETVSSAMATIPISITKRSIGIQLSRQSTPRCESRTNLMPHSRRQEVDEDDEELEYDYYDYANSESYIGFNSSLLSKPKFEFVSQIDIDQIVRQETTGWINESSGSEITIVQKHDVHTQI